MSRKGESQPRVDAKNCQLEKRLRTSSARIVGGRVKPFPLVKWTRPRRFFINPKWQVETGSESKERHIQRKRETKVTEAKYHRMTYVPANPFVASDALGFSDDDDSEVPIIPLIGIEETRLEDEDNDPPLVTTDPIVIPQVNNGPEVSTQPRLEEIDKKRALKDDHTIKVGETSTQTRTVSPLGPEVSTQPVLGRDEAMVIALELAAVIKAKEPERNIDTEILVQILRNPGMLEQIKNGHEVSSSPPLVVPNPTEVRPRTTVAGTTVQGPALDVGPSRTVSGITPVLIQGQRMEVRPRTTVVGTAPFAVQGPTLQARPLRTVVGTTPAVVQGPTLQVRPHRTIAVQRPSLEVGPCRTVVGTTPVAVQGPTLQVRPHRIVVGTTHVPVQGPTLQVRPHRTIAVQMPSLEVRPFRTVVGTTPVPVQKPSLEVRPRRTVVGTTPVLVQGSTLQVKPSRSVVGITPVAFQQPSLNLRPPKTVVGTTPVAVQEPTLDVSQPRTVVTATPVAIPEPYIKSVAKVPVGSPTTWVPSVPFKGQPKTVVGTTPAVFPGPTLDVSTARPVAIPEPFIKTVAKVPVGSQTAWAPSVPFTPLMSQGVKNTVDGIHNHLDTTHYPISSKVDLGEILRIVNKYKAPFQADRYSCSSSAPKTGPLVIKDSNYYRSIVSQYGGVAQENPNPQGPAKTVVRSNEPRICTYFNSKNGCMHGSNCLFKHVKVSTEGGTTLALEEQRDAKRMKFSGGSFAGQR